MSLVQIADPLSFACFCIVIGGYCTIPLIQSWVCECPASLSAPSQLSCASASAELTRPANNTGSQSQRAVHLGFLNSLANWAALTSPFIFPSKAKPFWHLGFGLNLGFSAAAIVVTALMMAYYAYENKRRDRVEGKPVPHQRVEQDKYHDLAPGFRYTL